MFRDNHYVPQWYQHRFFPPGVQERKFYYLDRYPKTMVSSGGRKYVRNSLLRWGPPNCFKLKDLYTTAIGPWFSTDIEEKFFGGIESSGKRAIEFFSNFDHRKIDGDALQDFLRYMSVQRLRTPQGLSYLSLATKTRDRNDVLMALQWLKDMHCALWTECVWSIADASNSATKFVLTDHPVALYNRAVFPATRHYADIRQTGTHTIFPLSFNKLLILTNLSWVRNPYCNPMRQRPNPSLFRGSFIDFREIQIDRMLTEREVQKINFIMMAGASRFVAAAEREWLYPELAIPPANRRWDRLDDGYLFMPDPRGVKFGGELVIGYKGGGADFFDAYGRKPWQRDYDDKTQADKEWRTFHAFQGEFARIHGPRRRGRSFSFDRLDEAEDDAEYHKHHLLQEAKFKPPGAKRWR